MKPIIYERISETMIIEKDLFGGEYIEITTETPVCEITVEAEPIKDISDICASHRSDPFWLRTKCGKTVDDIPAETLFFAVKHKDGSFSLYYSLASIKMRTSFKGVNGKLTVSAISGDKNVKFDRFYAYYKISGTDFYRLTENAAKSICEKFGTVSLRKNKETPDFMKYFGWCTWDSFYHDVSKDNIETGLKSFLKGGFLPKLVIIDDGWQTLEKGENEEDVVACRLSDFKANDSFGGELKSTVKMMKETYGVEKIFVWHAIIGYWSGVSCKSEAMKKYLPTERKSVHPEGIKENNLHFWESEQRPYGMIDPDMAEAFYDDYHTYLENEGIDGVKVDSQATSDSISEGLGGRCALVKKLHDALEKSVNKHFNGNLINCMSCSNDIIYHVKNSNMMRSSDDFLPTKPETHIKHIYNNAVSSIWMSEFTICDWDMFQTTHEYGKFHAAARSISGGPIYVSDKVDEHDFDIINALINEDGEILCSTNIARPVASCLFNDIFSTKEPFKIFNTNKCTGVVGAFSSEENSDALAKSITVSPIDIDGFNAALYAAYSFKTKHAFTSGLRDKFEISLKSKEFDIITYSEIKDGFAVIGITEKFNSGAAVSSIEKSGNEYRIKTVCGGTLLLYSETKPKNLSLQSIGNNFYELRLEKADTVIIPL